LPSTVKDHLAAIPSPPVAEEKGESAGKGEEAPEDRLLPPLVI